MALYIVIPTIDRLTMGMGICGMSNAACYVRVNCSGIDKAKEIKTESDSLATFS